LSLRNLLFLTHLLLSQPPALLRVAAQIQCFPSAIIGFFIFVDPNSIQTNYKFESVPLGATALRCAKPHLAVPGNGLGDSQNTRYKGHSINKRP